MYSDCKNFPCDPPEKQLDGVGDWDIFFSRYFFYVRQAQRDQLISSALDKLFDGDVSGGSSSSVMKGEKKEEGSGGGGVKKEGEDEQEEKLNDGGQLNLELMMSYFVYL